MERKSSKENTTNTALDNIIQMKWKQNDRPNNVKKSSTESTTTTDYRDEMKDYKIVLLVHESFYDSWTPLKESDRPSKEEPYFRYVHPSDKRAIFFYQDPMKELAKMPRRTDEHSARPDAAIESSLDPNVPAFVPLSNDDTTVTNTVNSTQTSVAAAAPKRRPGICMNRKPIEAPPDTGESSVAPPSTITKDDKTKGLDELLNHIDQNRLHSLTNYETESSIQRVEAGNPSDGILMNNFNEATQQSNVQDLRFAPTEFDTKAKDVSFSSSAMSALPTALVPPSIMNMPEPMAEYQMDFNSNIPSPYSVSEVPLNQVPPPYSVPSVPYNKSSMPAMEQDGQPFYQPPPPQGCQSAPEPLNRHPSPFGVNPNQSPYSMENEYSAQQASPVGQLASNQQNYRHLSSMSNQNQMHPVENNYSYQNTPITSQLPHELPKYRPPNSMSNQNCSYEPSCQLTPQNSQLASEMQHYRQTHFIPPQDRMLSMENERSLTLAGQPAPEPQNYHEPISHQNHSYSRGNEYSHQDLPPASRTASETRNYHQPSPMANQNSMYEQSRLQSPTQFAGPQNYCQSSSISNPNRMCSMENNQSLRQAPLADQLALKPQTYQPNSFPRQNQEYSNRNQRASEVRNHHHLNSVSNHNQIYAMENDQSYQEAFAPEHCRTVSARNPICTENDLSYQHRPPVRQVASDTHNRSHPFFTSNENGMSMMGQDAEFQRASSVCPMASQPPHYPQSRSVPNHIQTLMMEQNHRDFQYQPQPPECRSTPPPPVSMMQNQGAASHYDQPPVSMPVIGNQNTTPNEEYRPQIGATVKDSSISLAQLSKIINDSQLPDSYPGGHAAIPEEQYQAQEITRSSSPWYFQQPVNNQQMMQEQNNQCGVSFSSDL